MTQKHRRHSAKDTMPHLKSIVLLVVFWVFPMASAGWAGQAEEALNEGLKLHDAGKPKEAIREYDRALKANPKLADAYFNRGNAYYDLGQNDQAIKDYSEVIRLNPKDEYCTLVIQPKVAEFQQVFADKVKPSQTVTATKQ